MGSDKLWISLEEAATGLGCTPETVEDIARRGVVRSLNQGDKLLVRAEDLKDIKRADGAPLMTVDEMQKRIVMLEQDIARLRETVELLYQINTFAGSRLDPMDDDVLMQLYASICEAGCQTRWTIPRILSCCELFLRLSDSEVQRLNDLTESKDAWRPFFTLCLKQLQYVTTHPDFPYDIDFQRARDLLCRGRANLRAIAVVSIELEKSQGATKELLASMAAADIDAFDTMVRQLKAHSPRGGLQSKK